MALDAKKVLKGLWVEYWGELTAAEVADGMAAALVMYQGMSELEAAGHAGAYLGSLVKARENLIELLEEAERAHG